MIVCSPCIKAGGCCLTATAAMLEVITLGWGILLIAVEYINKHPIYLVSQPDGTCALSDHQIDVLPTTRLLTDGSSPLIARQVVSLLNGPSDPLSNGKQTVGFFRSFFLAHPGLYQFILTTNNAARDQLTLAATAVSKMTSDICQSDVLSGVCNTAGKILGSLKEATRIVSSVADETTKTATWLRVAPIGGIAILCLSGLGLMFYSIFRHPASPISVILPQSPISQPSVALPTPIYFQLPPTAQQHPVSAPPKKTITLDTLLSNHSEWNSELHQLALKAENAPANDPKVPLACLGNFPVLKTDLLDFLKRKGFEPNNAQYAAMGA